MARSLHVSRVLLLSAALCPACYAGVGPTVGFAGGSPTVGWEMSAEAFTVGQSFATDSEESLAASAKPGDYHFKSRSYLLFEPRLGGVGDMHQTFLFGGGGASLGMRWDGVAGQDRTEFGFLGGAFVGGGVAGPLVSKTGCQDHVSPFVSLAIGVRGSEVYLAPKVGMAYAPGFCLGDDSNEASW